MPPKRPWSQLNDGQSPPQSRPSDSSFDINAPSISRKVKACAACRKQKIKCIIDDRGPPCKRCTERNLACVLNKSLQTLIEERGQWRHTLAADLEHVHVALQQVLSQLSLPPLPPLQSEVATQQDESPQNMTERDDPEPSCDNSPRLSPGDDALHVPIESLYQITRLRALRPDDISDASVPSPTHPPNQPINDFISKGIVSAEDAQRLVKVYLQRIDKFIYLLGSGNYQDLESMRRGSPILTAAICTVATLHDPADNHLYGPCNREFRRLVAASMFERRINRDCMRAMCVGAYWLHDISWTLSGCAIRRATEINLHRNYQLVIQKNDEDAMDCMRIWYILYICDHHLSVLYGRQSIIHEDASILEWEELLKSPVVTDSDRRMISQIALLIIMSNIRDLFGPDTGEPIPRAFVSQLASFGKRIDQWMGVWSTELMKLHERIGEFPAKGVILHHHFAKLYLHSHVFRGLKGAVVPTHFRESAMAAVSASTAIIELILRDPDVRESLVGIPHYIHSMIAFACVLLLKVAAQHSGQYIDDGFVLDLITRVVQQFRSTSTGKYHLVHLMADGLEKMAASKIQSPSVLQMHNPSANGDPQVGLSHGIGSTATPLNTNGTGNMFANNIPGTGFEVEFGLGTSQFLLSDFGNFDFNFGGMG
ncbi:hypothetical protein COCC4DRAFT_67032 [Bipolaris maydis ATCC 48331]|uniref:Zn(2)-C6 fungal-type domain-containing protein n=2 Tax=Cochliobolus heterostrophus TaxID=5016 RepID=M2UJ36_COCH5|nr:uncharacterized protein COCC4DRAFT_67032 [Bipolaris maydis ATCC 48331]EMD93686.1 hypothetical protein COCHEDRAFT_1223353 [Bipolaris maydis C5]KAJ5020461.1 hypothetical protein J3E73DRAFT_376706 [Bipolaris maydis]ENH98790.1 hypothetical protein COCC4DRAFT_67032 [Bipolaris maydis ATCC 48331]KAJ5020619.1 hypothetical protein J3E73DRAFT_376484 [Bipolaris maydis]KAJ5027978.1 hypothetical protein J3E73DRAFT_368383 [Bipolaris maydis]